MQKILTIEEEKSPFRALGKFIKVLLLAYGLFWALSAVCFGIVDTTLHLQNSAIGLLSCRWKHFFCYPWYVFDVYYNWWGLLLKSFRQMHIYLVLFVPFAVPVGVVLSLVHVFFSRHYSFRFWFFLNHHFAKFKDVEKIGLHKGMFMVLGRFANKVLSVKPAESVLCVGEMGTGKTSSVAIPSVLRSGNACLIAVDMTGLLPKYTAGYRAKVGKIFYFNWDLLDDKEKGIFYPRWNPLSSENMPKEASQKEAYLRRISGYLANIDERDKDNYWNLLTRDIIWALLIYWVIKIQQAQANDYFLAKLVEGRHLSKEEKDILLSYYIQMPPVYSKKAIALLEENKLTADNYLPIGSWAGVLEQWIGKEACFASLTDWLIHNYLKTQDEQGKDWKGWLVSLMRESLLFGYGTTTLRIFKQFLELSTRQRQIAFACLIKPFRIFTNQALRERTDGNDFNLKNIRGIYDQDKKDWIPITIYSLANTHVSKILNQMFIDEALHCSLYENEIKGPLPLMLVLDDVGHNLKLNNLVAMIEASKSKKMSALLLCNSLSLVENTYSKEELERIVVNTSCKIIKAPDNEQMSRQLDKLASFATRSVQIPRTKRKIPKGSKIFADANYFHHLALDFRAQKNIKINTKDYQLVLVEGYYHRPILANNIYFAEDEKFKSLAVMDAEYALVSDEMTSEDLLARETPKVSAVFDQEDLGVDDLVELDQYMNMVFEEVLPEIEGAGLVKKEKKEADLKASDTDEKEEDWWMEEKSFQIKDKTSTNPFK